MWKRIMANLPWTSGKGTWMCRSNRPGRMSALSSDSGTLVAPIKIYRTYNVSREHETCQRLSQTVNDRGANGERLTTGLSPSALKPSNSTSNWLRVCLAYD